MTIDADIAAKVWFAGLLAVSLLLFAIGRLIGRRSDHTARIGIVFAVLLLVVSAVPKFLPALPYSLIPIEVLIWIEGVLGAPPWMFLVGVVSTSDATRRLHRASRLLCAFGIVYFMYGALWMVLPTIRIDTPEKVSDRGVTIQSRHDTCAPSSCATALRYLGLEASEAEMCAVVMAKPGKGSSLARTAYGLRDRVRKIGLTTTLLSLRARDVADIARRNRPVLVTVRSNIAADHMVAVLGWCDGQVLIANPSPGMHGGQRPTADFGYGWELYEIEAFESLYRGGAIVFIDAPRE